MSPELLYTGLFVLLIFIAGALVIFSSAYIKKNNTKLFLDLWRLYGIEVFIVAAVLIPAYFGGPVFLAVLLLFNFRAHVEIACLHGYPHRIFIITAGILLSSILVISGIYAVPDDMTFEFIAFSSVLTGALISLYLVSTRNQRYMPALLSIIIIIVSINCLLHIRDMHKGFLLIIFLYLVTETNDSFALVFGKLFGKRKLCPEISPDKTWEGMINGALIAFLAGLAYGYYILHLNILFSGMITAMIIVSAIFGDLLTSLYKRTYKCKDFKTLIEGHGGIMDIYDSLLISAITFYILIRLAGLS